MLNDEFKSAFLSKTEKKTRCNKAAQSRAMGEVCLGYIQFEWESTMNLIRLNKVYLAERANYISHDHLNSIHGKRSATSLLL